MFSIILSENINLLNSSMNSQEIIDEILLHPTVKYHSFDIVEDEKNETLEKLEKFCQENNYQLSISYYSRKNLGKISVRFIKVDKIDSNNEEKNNSAQSICKTCIDLCSSIGFILSSIVLVGIILKICLV